MTSRDGDEEIEISDSWYGNRSGYEAVRRAMKAQTEINKIIDDAQEKKAKKHTPTNCWCGKSWDLR